MTKQIIGGQMLRDGKALPLSKAVRAGDFIYISGQLGFDKEGNIAGPDIESQTTQALTNLQNILKDAGAAVTDIVKCTVWIADEKDFASFNKIYSSVFVTEPPARSCIPSKLLFNALVEIEAIVYKPL